MIAENKESAAQRNPKERPVPLSFRCPVTLAKSLQSITQLENRSLSSVITSAIHILNRETVRRKMNLYGVPEKKIDPPDSDAAL